VSSVLSPDPTLCKECFHSITSLTYTVEQNCILIGHFRRPSVMDTQLRKFMLFSQYWKRVVVHVDLLDLIMYRESDLDPTKLEFKKNREGQKNHN
jgi:hypothetical protein